MCLREIRFVSALPSRVRRSQEHIYCKADFTPGLASRGCVLSGFTKLHSSLTASSIWNEPDFVRVVWITMLSLADSEGFVKGSVPGLAHLARKTMLETDSALQILASPDPHSGRKENEGRRIVEVAGGWHLVTHAFYREEGMSEETKRYWRERKRNQRMSGTVKDSPRKSRKRGSVLVSVSALNGKESPERKGRCTQAEIEVFCESVGLPKSDGEATFMKWQGNGWTNDGKGIKDWKATVRSCKLQGYMPSQKPQLTANGKLVPKTKLDIEYEEHRERMRREKDDKQREASA